MATRTWVNGSGIPISAANLNLLEADVVLGVAAKTAVDLITLNSWQPSTLYLVDRFVLDPTGNVVKVITTHTSTGSFDASKFTASVVIADALVAGYVANTASATAAAINTALSVTTRTNYVTTPSFATNVAKLGYASGTGGGSSLSWQSGAGANGVSGFARQTWSTASSGGGGGMNGGTGAQLLTPIPAGSYTVGDTYTVSAWVRASKAISVNFGGYFRLGSGSALAGTAQTTFSLTANTWTRVSCTLVVPATADNAYFYVYASGAATWAIADTLDLDDVLFEKTSTLLGYFDGGTAPTSTTANQWSGTPQASASTQRVYVSAIKSLVSRTGAPPVGQGDLFVNVADYLAANRVIGVTDDLPAFTAALAATTFGSVRVFVPAGEYWLSSAILMPSNSELAGAGIDKAIIRLLASAANDTWVITNATPLSGGNTNISVHDLTVDWQWSATRVGGAGGSRSSCVTMRNVQYFWLERIKCINPGQHGIDIASGSLDYASTGDGGTEPTDASRYGWVRNNIISGFLDDGITTHHSEYIWIEDNHCTNPRYRGNCNGLEVDDGSRHIFLARNYSEGCYSGIEVKAHGTSNAARNIHIQGHMSVNDVRSYNFRHIDHHTGADPISLSAFDITASDLFSLYPNNDKGFQDEATPRALVISAYHRVSVTNFTAIGRGGYSAGDVAIAIQYRAKHISLSGVNVTGWGGADKDISVTTDGSVSISGVNISKSAASAIYIGSTVTGAQIWGVNATAPAGTTSAGVDIYNSTNVEASGLNIVGYTYPVRSDLINYVSVGAFYRKIGDVPAGVTVMRNLDPSKDYYASTATFAAFTTDRPDGAAGAYFITHSRMSGDAVIQTITRNTSGTPVQYWRIVYYTSTPTTSSAWQQATITAVAYSPT